MPPQVEVASKSRGSFESQESRIRGPDDLERQVRRQSSWCQRCDCLGGTEVADVTITVAALVYHNRLLIPSGVHKSNSDPTEEKVLHIRYSYQGKEAIVEVKGDDEQLVLPPHSLLHGS
ncbi:hypothetical protein EV127DRAFT_414413 [Xylaria flabelliformis]|nr:hypothetical protein EV127DRAFT_414413 [Xylaria flabelliformis]